MRRREFIATAAGLLALPAAGRAQPAPKQWSIGFLGASSPATASQRTMAFTDRLRELGWIEGRTINVEYRWAQGHTERFAEIAVEFVRLHVDVIVTSGAGPVIAAKQATATIPIVFTVASDPVGTGLVPALRHPGGNVTGLSYQGPDLAAKRIELLREAVPSLRRVAVLANIRAAGALAEMREVQATATTLGIAVAPLEIGRSDDVAPAVEGLKQRADALYICADPLANTLRVRLVTLALAERLPTMFGERENVEAGGLMSYGPNLPDLYRRAAELVDKILRGAKPGDLPVEQPTRFDLVLNRTTAKALGLSVPPTLLARADEVIE